MSLNQPSASRPDGESGPDEGIAGPSWDGPGAGNPARARGLGAAARPNAADPFAATVPGASRYLDGHPGSAALPRPLSAGSPGRRAVRIGLWGAPRSGKTTFLASLPIAAMQHGRNERGNWVISGTSAEANDFLNRGVNLLAMERGFPGATVGVQRMTWSFQGEEPRPLGGIRQVGFELDIHDVSGESFRPEHPQHAAIVNQLADAGGLIYLFDPLLDSEQATQSLQYFYATLNALNSRVREQRGLLRNRLPHQVAVCVAKFDDPELFQPSVEAGWVTQDDVGARLPRVPEHLGAGYFGWLCDTFRGSTTMLVRDALNSYFHPDRISYHAISAIGFRLNEAGIFDYQSYSNVELIDGQPRIATVPQPLNVLEPLVELERRVSEDSGNGNGSRLRRPLAAVTGVRHPGTEPLSAHWAVLGKRPGETMGYEVLGGSLPQARAGRWLWGAQTGTPAVRRGGGPDELPWRVFLSGVDGEQTAACALVEHSWDGSLDGTGAPIITSRLLLLDWAQASRAGVTWSTLADAAAAVRWPRHRPDAPPLELAAAPAHAEALAAAVEDLGFDWAATVAALLLDGHLVVVTPASRPLPPPDERVWLVDAIGALLPYGCRRWLSAATWSGMTEHQLTLAFAESARSAQTEVRYGEPAPALAPDADAGRYLGELRRLRRKGFATVDLVRHLLGATTPLKWRDGAGAFRALREVDLVDSVVAEVQAGRGRAEDVGRALALPDAARLDADRAGVLLRFLGRSAVTGGVDSRARGGVDSRALDLLRQHWRPELPRWLAADVLAEPAAGPALDRAMACLDLLRELCGPGSAEFTELLTTLVHPATAAGRQHAWCGSLAWQAQQAFGAEAASADHLLVGHPELGRAWAQAALGHGGPDRQVLGRLLTAAQHLPLRQSTGWLRYAAYLIGLVTQSELSPGDAEDFARAGAGPRWRRLLPLAAENRRAAVLQDLWSLFWVVALSPEGPELAEQLARLALPDGEGGRPEADLAADLDLIRLIAGRGRAGPPLAALERHLAGERRATAAGPPHGTSPAAAEAGWTDRYAQALARRLATLAKEIPATVVDALLGDRPDPGRWRVLEQLLAEQARTESALVEALAGRLRTGDRSWLTLGLPPRVLAALTALPGLRDVDALAIVSHLLHARPDPERLGEVLADTAGAGPLPQALAGEVLPVLAGWPAPQVDRLAQELWWRAPHLATELYQHIAGRGDTARLREQLLHCSENELHRLRTARALLGHGGGPQAPAATAPRDGPPVESGKVEGGRWWQPWTRREREE